MWSRGSSFQSHMIFGFALMVAGNGNKCLAAFDILDIFERERVSLPYNPEIRLRPLYKLLVLDISDLGNIIIQIKTNREK